LGAQQIWGLVTAPLAQSRRVITLDLPGFGESAPVGEGFDLGEVSDRPARALAGMPGSARRLDNALLHRNPGLLHRVIAGHAAPTERAWLAEAGERQAAGTSFLSATAYGVGGMIEDYLTYPGRGSHRLSEAGARALLAARVAA
jgi:pimeloyl-ACP methyl ester carboxylesterase